MEDFREGGRKGKEKGKDGKHDDFKENVSKLFLLIISHFTPVFIPVATEPEAGRVKERGKAGKAGGAAAAAAAGGTQEEGGGEGGEEGGEEQGGLKLQILARGDLRVGAELSQRHHMYFILGESSLASSLLYSVIGFSCFSSFYFHEVLYTFSFCFSYLY